MADYSNRKETHMPDNNILEQAADAFIKEKTKDNFVKMMEELEKASVFLPAMFPEEMDEETKAMIKAGKSVKVSKDTKIVPCLLKNNSGEQMLPIFSSGRHIPKERRSPALLNMPFLNCVNMALSNADKIKAVVLNPFTQNIVVSKEMMEVARKRGKMTNAKAVQVTEKQFHYLAHRRFTYETLPKFLFTGSKEALEKLQREEGQLLISLCASLYPEKIKPPYRAEAFSTMTLNITDNLQITRIDLPEQYVAIGSCIRAYAVWKRDSETLKYYTVEKAQDIVKKEETQRLGGILPDGSHANFGQMPDNGAELERIMNLAENAD